MIRKPTILMWTFLLLCTMIGAGQPWLRLVSVWLLLLVCWLEMPQVAISKSIGALIGIAVCWWLLLLLPLPLSVHSILMPEISSLRNPIGKFIGIDTLPLAIAPSIHMVDGVALMLFGWILLSTRTLNIQHWMQFLCAAGVVLIWMGWLHKIVNADHIFGFVPIPTEARSPYFAPFINGNHAGYLFAALIPCAIRLQSQIIIRAGVLLHLLVAIPMTESRGAIAVGLLMLTMELPFYRIVLAVGSVLGAGAIWYWSPSINAITHGRVDLWQDALSALSISMPLGTGFGGFSDVYSIVKSTPEYSHSSHAHQEYLEWGISTGIFGLLTAIFGLFMWIKRPSSTLSMEQRPFQRILLVFTLAGFVDFPLQLNALLLLEIVAIKVLLQDTRPSLTNTFNHRLLMIPSVFVAITSILWSTNTPYGMSKTSDPMVLQVQQSPLNETKLTKLLITHIELDPTQSELAALIQLHASHHPTNIETQKMLARWYFTTNQYDHSCRVWNEIWSLNTPILSNKIDLVPEALGCDTNLWNAVIALPDDVDILVRAYQILMAQNLETAALFCLQRAHDLNTQSPLGTLHYVQWLIQSKNWNTAWIEHNTLELKSDISKSQRCLHLKNTAALGFQYSLNTNPQDFQNLMDTCGQAPHWMRRKVLAELKLGDPNAIKTAIEWTQQNPKDILNLWKFLAHAEQINGNIDTACHWIQTAFHSKSKRISQELIERCAHQEPPFKKEVWKIQSKNDIDMRIQSTLGQKPL